MMSYLSFQQNRSRTIALVRSDCPGTWRRSHRKRDQCPRLRGTAPMGELPNNHGLVLPSVDVADRREELVQVFEEIVAVALVVGHLDLHQLLLLVTLDLVDLGHEAVGELLQLLLGPASGHLGRWRRHAQASPSPPWHVAGRCGRPPGPPRPDGGPALTSSFLRSSGERREGEADHVAVVAGRDAEVALHDRLLDRGDRALVERLHLQRDAAPGRTRRRADSGAPGVP